MAIHIGNTSIVLSCFDRALRLIDLLSSSFHIIDTFSYCLSHLLKRWRKIKVSFSSGKIVVIATLSLSLTVVVTPILSHINQLVNVDIFETINTIEGFSV